VAWIDRFRYYDHHLERCWCWLVETTPTVVTQKNTKELRGTWKLLLCSFVLLCFFATKFSTGSEENFVEIIGKVFTKLLQTHTYNILHT
jgi:hypothetical protein